MVDTNLKGTGKAKHNETTSDHNHPTRASGVGGVGGVGDLGGCLFWCFCSPCGCPRCSYTHAADLSAEGFEHVDSFHVAEHDFEPAAE